MPRDYENCKEIGHSYDAEVMLVNCIWQMQMVQPCFHNHGWQIGLNMGEIKGKEEESLSKKKNL